MVHASAHKINWVGLRLLFTVAHVCAVPEEGTGPSGTRDGFSHYVGARY